jgi:hypothetical protein
VQGRKTNVEHFYTHLAGFSIGNSFGRRVFLGGPDFSRDIQEVGEWLSIPEATGAKTLDQANANAGAEASTSGKAIVRLFSEHNVKFGHYRYLRKLPAALLLSCTCSLKFGMIPRAEEMRAQANPGRH